MIKKVCLVSVVLFIGCIPSSQQVQTLTNEISKVQGDIALVNEAVKEKADQGFVDALAAGWEASAPINPYYGYGALLIAGIKIYADSKKSKKLTAKYQAHKEGAEKFRIENPDKSAALYNDIGEARVRNNV